ncbi:GntR family transcriptional regulator [Cryobacterium sp. PH31-O1]|uniref:GntR family transcriptional regulator n=1 Tax=Cryobacterium sp. PH31-O1 TaxID=3046306 RepID=UPI0024B8E1D5|nr:GntR family transcriptional regulator [Cryobacterium sp. PH31-O1]MDJ0336810.1 GntR family transcriptional regulator [Cryobacterium sp. PH31-O1]
MGAQLRGSILLGELRPGESKPSTGALAGRLGVSRGSVVPAYDQLNGEGYLVTRQGAPARVAVLLHGAGAVTPTRVVVAPAPGRATSSAALGEPSGCLHHRRRLRQRIPPRRTAASAPGVARSRNTVEVTTTPNPKQRAERWSGRPRSDSESVAARSPILTY